MPTQEETLFEKRAWSRRSLLGFLILGAAARARSDPPAPKARAARLVQAWENVNLTQDAGARGLFQRAGHVYVGYGPPLDQNDPYRGRILKVRTADGAVVWSYATRNTNQPSYPVSNGNVVVFGTDDKTITGISDETGELLWKIPTRGANFNAACFAGNRTIIPTNDGLVYAIHWASGRVLWRTGVHGEEWTGVGSTPCVWQSRVLVGCDDGYLYVLDQATGRIRNKIDCGGAVQSNPVVVDQLAFVSAAEFTDQSAKGLGRECRTMLVIDLTAGKVIQRFTAQRRFPWNPIVAGHQVFFPDGDTLYAYNASRRALDWKTEKPLAVIPYPLVFNHHLLLPMNPGPSDVSFEHPTRCVILDRATGMALAECKTGGVVASPYEHYAWTGDRLILSGPFLRAYRVEVS